MKKSIKVIALLLTSVSVLSASENLNVNNNLFGTKKVNRFKAFTPLSNYDDGGAKGQIMVTAGAAFNFSEFNFKRRYDDGSFSTVSTFYYISAKSSPFLNLVLDYGLLKKLSIGVAVGYQSTVVEWKKTGYYSNNNFVSDTLSGKDTWTRIHVAVRGDFRILAKKEFGVYAGARLGYNYYTMKSTYSDTISYLSKGIKLQQLPFSAQAHLGFSYWLKGIVGVNAEMGIGLGGPYVFGLGITNKFN